MPHSGVCSETGGLVPRANRRAAARSPTHAGRQTSGISLARHWLLFARVEEIGGSWSGRGRVAVI